MEKSKENQFSDRTSDLNSAAETEACVLRSGKQLPSDTPRISVDDAAAGQGTQMIPKDYSSADHDPDKSKISALQEADKVMSAIRAESKAAASSTRTESTKEVLDKEETSKQVTQTETSPAALDSGEETIIGAKTSKSASDIKPKASTSVSSNEETSKDLSGGPETSITMQRTESETYEPASNTKEESDKLAENASEEISTNKANTRQEENISASNNKQEVNPPTPNTGEEIIADESNTGQDASLNVTNTGKEPSGQKCSTVVSNSRYDISSPLLYNTQETNKSGSHTGQVMSTDVLNTRQERSTPVSNGRHETDRGESNTRQETGTAVSENRQETGTAVSNGRHEANMAESARRSSKDTSELRGTNTTGNPNLRRMLGISRVEKKLLLMKNIRKDLVYELSNTGSEVDKGELEKGRIVVVRGNADDVWKIFKSKVKTERVIVNTFMTDVERRIDDIAQKFSDWLKVDQGRQCYYFAFHTDIEAEVLPKIADLRIVVRFYSLPSYLVRYICCYRQGITKAIQKQLSHSVKLEITPIHDPAGILVESDGYPDIEKVLNRLFSDLQYTEFEIQTETAVFLQTVLGNKQVRDIENKYYCQIRVRSPNHQVELRAVSPRKRHLLLCQGDVQYTDCQVLVLPFHEGQTEWCPQYKKILERGFLSTEVKPYAAKLRPSPSQQFILPLRPTMEEKEKHVVVMYVPEPTSDKMRDFILAACTQAFDFASSKNLNLALPVQLSDGLQVKTFKTMLCAICEHMEREDTFNDIVLYISDTSQLKTLMDISSKYLMRCEGWYTDVIFRERPETTSGTSHRIKIAVDELQKFKADVLVNSTDRGLEHTHAAVSGLILQTVGPQLQELCHLLYPSGIEDRILAVTPSGIDQWKEIYHIVLPQTWKDQHENYLLSELRKRVQGCLTVASANNHESIAFPTLGTGKLLYPPEKVAHTMFNAARDFFASMPHSTLKKVTIVCFPKNTEIIKVFKAEEALHIFKVDKSLNQEARLGVENRLVQIVVPNTEKEEIPDICDIVYDFIQEDARKKQKGSFMKDKTKTKSLMVIFKKKDKREAVSLQINLMRAGSEDLADIVKAVGKKLSKCLKCLIVIMAVADVSSLRSVCEEFQAQQKASSFWNPFSWLTGGKSEMKSPVNPSFSKSPPKQEIGVICVCGNSGVFDKVKAEMKKIFIPEKYRQLAAELNDGVSVDSDLGAVNNVVNQNFGQPKKEECILTIPMADLPGLDENAFNPVLNPVTNHKKGCLTFSVPFKDLQAAVDDVTAVIKSADNISQKADVSTLRQIKLNPVIERTVDCLEYEALKYLLGEPFILTKTDEKDGMVTFSIPADRSPEDIDDKIGSLRQEVVSLEGANMSNIENPINTRSEGVEAFMKIIQQERKVVIFCFDYNNMNKAKHLLQVKTGKIKTTSRAARKFGEGLASSTSQQPSADSYSKPADRLELNTKSGIKIYVYKTDITKLPVDGIVNAANNNLQHGGGVAAAIAKAAGPSLEEEGDDYINKHGPLKVSQVISTSSGALPCKTVLHAVGPRWDDYQDKRQCQQDLEQTIFNCLETAHNMKLGSLAVSSISSAIFGVPKNVCAEMYMQAVQRFDDHHGAASCVRHIHFADISDEMVSNIQAVFTQKMNIVASCQHGDSMKAVRSLDTAQQNSSDKMQEDPTVSKKQQNKGETTHPDSSVKDAQQTAKDKIPSTPIVASTQQNMAQSVTRVDSTQQSTHSTALALTSGLDFHSTTNLNKEPAVKVTQSSGVLGLEWTICFHELEYFIGQQDISQITTDAIIFWHIDGRVVDERSLKKLVKTSEFSSFKKKQLAEGKIHTFQGSRCKWLVFVVVPPLNRGSLENVTSIVEKALQKVDNLEAKSVALLHFPHSKEVRKDNEHQAEVFSSALKKLAGRPQKSLKKVYIVNLEEEFISLLGKEVLASIQRNDHRVHGYLSRDQEQLTAENLTEAELTPRNERGDTVVQESAV